MYAQKEKPKENQTSAVANSVVEKKSNGNQSFGFVDNRLETIAQSKMIAMPDQQKLAFKNYLPDAKTRRTYQQILDKNKNFSAPTESIYNRITKQTPVTIPAVTNARLSSNYPIQRSIGFEFETRIPVSLGARGNAQASTNMGNIAVAGLTLPADAKVDSARNMRSDEKADTSIIEIVTAPYDETTQAVPLAADLVLLGAWATATAIAATELQKKSKQKAMTNYNVAGAGDIKLGHPIVMSNKVSADAYPQATMGVNLAKFGEALDVAQDSKRIPAGSPLNVRGSYTNGGGRTDSSRSMRNVAVTIGRLLKLAYEAQTDGPASAEVNGFMLIVGQTLAGHKYLSTNKGLDKNAQLLLPKTSFQQMRSLLAPAEQGNLVTYMAALTAAIPPTVDLTTAFVGSALTGTVALHNIWSGVYFAPSVLYGQATQIILHGPAPAAGGSKAPNVAGLGVTGPAPAFEFRNLTSGLLPPNQWHQLAQGLLAVSQTDINT